MKCKFVVLRGMQFEECGSERFAYYQTITEAADVRGIDDDGTLVIGDKWEITDCTSSKATCENGHALPIDPESTTADAWNGEVRD